MAQIPPPKLSIILVTPNAYDTLRDVISCYRAQSAAKDIEVVLGTSNPESMAIVEADFSGFHSWHLVKTPDVKHVGVLKAVAVAKASADLIVFGEDHSFPLLNWAEVLIDRHKGSWAAVGPRVINLNKDAPQTWPQAYMEYGPWITQEGEGVTEQLPGHNSSFKKTYLLEYGENLADMLLSEFNLFLDLGRKGHQLYFEPKAITRHLNFEHFLPLIHINFLAGRQFAAWRSREFGFTQKLIYIIGAPLIPLVRFRRILQMMRRYQQPDPVSAAILISLIINLVVDGVGQFLGYTLGPGNTSADIFAYEFYRTRFVRDTSVIEKLYE